MCNIFVQYNATAYAYKRKRFERDLTNIDHLSPKLHTNECTKTKRWYSMHFVMVQSVNVIIYVLWVHNTQHKNQAMGNKQKKRSKKKAHGKIKWAKKSQNKAKQMSRRKNSCDCFFFLFLFFLLLLLQHTEHLYIHEEVYIFVYMSLSISKPYTFDIDIHMEMEMVSARCVWPQFLLTATICFSLLCVCCVVFLLSNIELN